MFKVYAVIDECHGNIGYYADITKAKERCKENAKDYDINPDKDELEYDGERYWGWTFSYVVAEEVEE